ncbi:hypothetical protein [Rickettsia felis]|uniref:hypothetical protein n=1 Tax=Rickettsia felis TaxID=42862 RepID=UPI001F2DADBF|nr:hypothetical protein [Rickettsia felis]
MYVRNLRILDKIAAKLRSSQGIVAWIDFSSLREELRSNSTKQGRKKNSVYQNFFNYFSGLPRRFAPRNDGSGIHATMPPRNDDLEVTRLLPLKLKFCRLFTSKISNNSFTTYSSLPFTH